MLTFDPAGLLLYLRRKRACAIYLQNTVPNIVSNTPILCRFCNVKTPEAVNNFVKNKSYAFKNDLGQSGRG